MKQIEYEEYKKNRCILLSIWQLKEMIREIRKHNKPATGSTTGLFTLRDNTSDKEPCYHKLQEVEGFFG